MVVMKYNKKSIDWQKIERDYRAGMKTLRQIAEENGVSHTAINKRAKRDEWTRDLSAKIAAKIDELVSRKVSNEVSRSSPGNRESERRLVCDNGKTGADLIWQHRKALERNAALVGTLENEIEVFEGDLPEKVRVLKMLMEARRIVIDLQRQAFGLDPKGGGHNALGEKEGGRFVVNLESAR